MPQKEWPSLESHKANLERFSFYDIQSKFDVPIIIDNYLFFIKVE